MNNESVAQYIQRNQSEVASLEADIEKRRKRVKKLFIAFFISLAAAFIIVPVMTSVFNALTYSSLKSAVEKGDIETIQTMTNDPDSLSYKDSVLLFEKAMLGNSNQNVMVQSGLVCNIGDTKYQAITGNLTRYTGQKSEVLVDESCSYLNRYKDGLLFRYDSTRTLGYIAGGTATSVLSGYTVGEILTCADSIFFLNIADNNTLWLSTDGTNAQKIADESCKSFAIAGNRAIILTNDNQLISMRWDGSGRNTINGVQSFILTDKIYAYSGGTIFTCGVNFKHPKLVCKDVGYPLFVGQNGIYLQRDKSIILLRNGEEKTLLDNVLVCKGVFENSAQEVVIRTLTIDSDGKKDENIVCKIEG